MCLPWGIGAILLVAPGTSPDEAFSCCDMANQRVVIGLKEPFRIPKSLAQQLGRRRKNDSMRSANINEKKNKFENE